MRCGASRVLVGRRLSKAMGLLVLVGRAAAAIATLSVLSQVGGVVSAVCVFPMLRMYTSRIESGASKVPVKSAQRVAINSRLLKLLKPPRAAAFATSCPSPRCRRYIRILLQHLDDSALLLFGDHLHQPVLRAEIGSAAPAISRSC